MAQKRWKRYGVVLISLFVLVVVIRAVSWIGRFMKTTGVTPGFLMNLVVNSGTTLRSNEKRTNILLLGIGGGAHEGSDLTDTMIVLSLDKEKASMSMISIPRDMWSAELRDKVNSAYHYGEEKKIGGGFVLAKSTVADVIGMPVHYVFLIDFTGFQKIIDLVGGIPVNVSAEFTDTEFPVAGRENDECEGDPARACRYELLHFDSGEQLMDGARALQYVRSRHAQGTEGSDFARSKRQQDVLMALKSKLSDPGVWFSPRLPMLMQAFDDATGMDLNISELATVGKRIAQIPSGNIQKISIEPLLIAPPPWQYDGKYVLIPRGEDAEIHAFINAQL
ncbi:LCP family protein [Candidatus Gottesmanbacteria bacterium]|nr:LCP family protein [Candidatus Gottesmanbacteria bacterium]